MLVIVQLTTSPPAGVSENDVPAPVGSVVAEPAVLLVHEIDEV